MKTCPTIFVRLALYFILCSFSATAFAQNGEVMNRVIAPNESNNFVASISSAHPNYSSGIAKKEIENISLNKISGTANKVNATYVIPLVFHIVSQNPSAITDLQIMNAVQDLNDAFAHTGVYAVGPGANTGITFCLAKIDPDGGITNGITRTISDLSDVDQDIEDAKLKNLVSWDTKQYCNIWVVDSIESEILSTFSCGVWSRMHESGYSGLLGNGDYKDGIVVTAFGTLLAHEMGHYLGLLHTFVLNSCQNNNCATDGDGVCDTPPQSVPGGSCTAPQNSCATDTVSGFATNVPDLNSNFMSYSGTCTNEFTAGQAAKMITNLTTVRSSLLAQDKCTPPCAENILAGFTRNNWSPIIGDNINFTNTSTGGSNYEWSVDGTLVATTANYSQTFPAAGKYKVTLKVYNANPLCFSTYTDFIIVNCGVIARFNPDKRTVASKTGVAVDSILFKNKSIGVGLTYKWLMSNDQGMTEQVVGVSTDLTYTFPKPAHYSVRLIATNGACSDTTGIFTFTVLDPTPDGFLNFIDVQCYQETKIKVTISACNNGYGNILPNIPLSFYDADPTKAGANKLATVTLPDTVHGKCCGTAYTYILDLKKQGQNLIYAVLNDDGTTSPLIMPNPNNKQIETNYINDISFKQGFQFKVTAIPPIDTLEPGDTLQLIGQGVPGNIASSTWSSAEGLSCTNCLSPIFIAGKRDITKKLVETSTNGCTDSAYSVIKIPPADDYVISINSLDCSANDSLRANFTICNQFKRGTIPAGLKISFYDADPSTTGAHLLGPSFMTTVPDPGKCVSYTHIFKGVDNLTNIFAVVNDSGTVATPVSFPQDTSLLEKIYSNNMTSNLYQPDTLALQPADTLVLVNSSFNVNIISPLINASSINWATSNSYVLSCYNCASPVATIRADGQIRVKTTNQFGCAVTGTANIKVIPPDMTIQIRQTNCSNNDSLLVKFTICMSNNYDSVFKGIPVSFYESDPSKANPVLLGTIFTQQTLPGNCNDFSGIIKSPNTQNIFAVVNDQGQNGIIPPDNLFQETDLTNNVADTTVVPFTVTVQPADTTVPRSTPVQIITQVSGGQVSSVNWSPISYLSCTDCLSPVAAPTYSLQYKVTVTNEYSCTVTRYVSIKTFSTGIDVSIPNVFTPNADGHNDVFFILGSQKIKIIRDFSIFNRWGQKVFQANNIPANDPAFGWNGYYNGKTVDAGAYVYMATIEFIDGHREGFKGAVVLIR